MVIEELEVYGNEKWNGVWNLSSKGLAVKPED